MPSPPSPAADPLPGILDRAAYLRLKSGEKTPADTGWRDHPLDRAQAEAALAAGANVGVQTGEPSGSLVDVDLDDATAARTAGLFLPATGAVFGRASRPGSHRLYVCPGLPGRTTYRDPVKQAEGGAGLILEVRADGHQTMFPGSTHPSGEPVVWVGEEGEPAAIEPGELLARAGELAAATLLAHHSPDGGRHDAALHTAGGLLRGGWEADETRRFVEQVCRMAGDTAELADRMRAAENTVDRHEAGEAVSGWKELAGLIDPRVVKQARVWLGTSAATEQPWSPDERPRTTDGGNARRLAKRHGERIRHVAAWGQWLLWSGQRWEPDEDQGILRLALDTVASIYIEAGEESDPERREKLAKWGIQSENGTRVRQMISLGSALEGVAITSRRLDRDRWLLNCTNGTIDLRTGELRPHTPDDLITKLAPVAYDPTATCPTWRAFLDHAMRGDAEMLGFLQRLMGLCLTGVTTEKILPIIHGEGDTGKTTFTETLLALLGEDYAQVVPETTISRKHWSDGIPNDVARLRGIRLAVVSETGQDMALNEARIKAFTGRNKLVARFLHQEFFEFVAEFKLIIETNNRPRIQENSSAVWNRIKLVPFTVVVPKAEQDGRLPEKLRAELPGILAWAVEGCLAWQRVGLGEPSRVAEATAEYQGDSDLLAAFLAECCVIEEGAKERSGTVYQHYQSWMRERGQHPLGDQRFSAALKDRGFKKPTLTGIAHWRGLRLQEELSRPSLVPMFGGTPNPGAPSPFGAATREGEDGAAG